MVWLYNLSMGLGSDDDDHHDDDDDDHHHEQHNPWDQHVEDSVLRAFISIDLVIFTFNLSMAIYIMVRMMLPQQIRFALLWVFYFVVCLVSVL